MKEVARRALFESVFLLCVTVVVALGVNALRPDRLKIFGTDCIRQFGVCSRSIKQSETIDLDKALALFYNKAAIFIDARSPLSYSMGHIPGAINIPANGEISQYEDLIGGFAKNSFVVVYDEGVGGTSAADVASMLKKKGFSNVLLFPNGFSEWHIRGLPVDFGSGGLSFSG